MERPLGSGWRIWTGGGANVAPRECLRPMPPVARRPTGVGPVRRRRDVWDTTELAA